MADFSGLTSRQHMWVTSRAYDLMRQERVEVCTCGDASRGHSPDCLGELDLERRYSAIVEQLREDMPDDAELLKAEGTLAN